MFEQASAPIDSSRRHPGFAQAAIGELGIRFKLPKNRAVFRAGDDADRFFEIVSGAVMIYRILDDGRRQVVEFAFPGAICGMTAGEQHESCCDTLMPTVLRSFKRNELGRSDAFRMRIVKQLEAQLSAMHDHAVSLGCKTAEERVCTFILRLSALECDVAHGVKQVSLPMSRKVIADYLGLTLETVCRTIADLARRGVVTFGEGKRHIVVPDVERLGGTACSEAQYA